MYQMSRAWIHRQAPRVRLKIAEVSIVSRPAVMSMQID